MLTTGPRKAYRAPPAPRPPSFPLKLQRLTLTFDPKPTTAIHPPPRLLYRARLKRNLVSVKVTLKAEVAVRSNDCDAIDRVSMKANLGQRLTRTNSAAPPPFMASFPTKVALLMAVDAWSEICIAPPSRRAEFSVNKTDSVSEQRTPRPWRQIPPPEAAYPVARFRPKTLFEISMLTPLFLRSYGQMRFCVLSATCGVYLGEKRSAAACRFVVDEGGVSDGREIGFRDEDGAASSASDVRLEDHISVQSERSASSGNVNDSSVPDRLVPVESALVCYDHGRRRLLTLHRRRSFLGELRRRDRTWMRKTPPPWSELLTLLSEKVEFLTVRLLAFERTTVPSSPLQSRISESSMVMLDPAIALMLLAPSPFALFRNATDLRVAVAPGPTTSGASTPSNSHCSTAMLEITTTAALLRTHPSPFSGRRRRTDLISKTGFALHANVVFPSATDSMETFLLMRIVSFAEKLAVANRIAPPSRRQLTTSWKEVPDASMS